MLLAKIVMTESNTKRECFIVRIPEIISSSLSVEVCYQWFYSVEHCNHRQQDIYKKLNDNVQIYDSETDAYNDIQKVLSNFEILLKYAKTGFLTVYASTEENGKVVDNIEEVFESDPKSHAFKDFDVWLFDLETIGGYDVLDRYFIPKKC